MKTFVPALIFILTFPVLLKAQTAALATVKSEIEEAAMKEQNAFKNANCTEVLNFMEPEITFLANGRKAPSKEMIGKFCNAIPRPFKTATVDRLDVYPLSNDVGYVIRTLEYPNDEKTKMQEFVTKVWRKTDGKWKITHFHSTVKEVQIAD